MAIDETQANWSYAPDGVQPNQDQNTGDPQHLPEPQEPITWTASEYVANHKDTRWFTTFFFFLIVCVGLVYFLTKDIISVVVIAVIGLIFSFLANKKPKQISYEINEQGISINGRVYSFTEFKSFSISNEGVIGAINLLPLKRFMPDISIYFPPEQGEEIINILSRQLPHEQRIEHSMDRLAKRFRF